MKCLECECTKRAVKVEKGGSCWWDFACSCCQYYPEKPRRCGPFPAREGWDGGLLSKLIGCEEPGPTCTCLCRAVIGPERVYVERSCAWCECMRPPCPKCGRPWSCPCEW